MFAKYYIVCYGLSGSLGEQMDAEAGKILTATAVDKFIHLIHYTQQVFCKYGLWSINSISWQNVTRGDPAVFEKLTTIVWAIWQIKKAGGQCTAGILHYDFLVDSWLACV